MRNQDYLPRIIDKAVESHLKTFGAVCIEGAKWCGKTWTANIHSNSSIYLGYVRSLWNLQGSIFKG